MACQPTPQRRHRRVGAPEARGRRRAAALALGLTLLHAPAHVTGQALERHGEGAIFQESGISIVWGVLRAPVEDETQVVIRIAVTGARYAYVRIDAVDPFARARRPVAPGGPLTGALDVRSPRLTFGDFPRRELRFYRSAEDWRADAPALTIYYLGVPDTTPEFVSESALLDYLAASSKARPP